MRFNLFLPFYCFREPTQAECSLAAKVMCLVEEDKCNAKDEGYTLAKVQTECHVEVEGDDPTKVKAKLLVVVQAPEYLAEVEDANTSKVTLYKIQKEDFFAVINCLWIKPMSKFQLNIS